MCNLRVSFATNAEKGSLREFDNVIQKYVRDCYGENDAVFQAHSMDNNGIIILRT